jgi:hypothetical protein
MLKYLTLFLLWLPFLTKGQCVLAKSYVEDRINNLTYLHFHKNGTFEYRYTYDLINDMSEGYYKCSNDTIFLIYNKNTIQSTVAEQLSSHDKFFRADTLIVKGYKLYQVKSGVSDFDKKPVIIDTKTHKGWKPPKNWLYIRKFWLFGPYQSTPQGQYYMIDERHAAWATKK